MKTLFSWLIKPAVLALLGVLLLALIIWFEAPLLAFDGHAPFASESVRWTFILLFLLLWAGWFGGRVLRAWWANRRLMKSVAGADQQAPGQDARDASAAELAQLHVRMQEALAILKKTRTGGQGGLYQLPWYLFIGAPGSGKTTALTQSGLKFPLAERMGKGAIGGVGGTRNCDWWFTDQAVLLDTAGRYTTQDSHAEADHAAWTGFLQLLRKYRRRRPVNGVIVALSVADLLQEDEAGRAAQARNLRARIKELHEQLGVHFPVYVLVTKCDLLAGFVEFFDTLGREERAQVWGMTFALEGQGTDAALTAFPDEFRLLEQRLQERVLARMQQERDPRKRALIYSFPQQFAGVRDVLGSFLRDVFESNRYERQPLLRGVYFSSGTQEGSPLDRVMSAMAAAFGLGRQALAPQDATGRSYFLTRLLDAVIFPEAELAGVNRTLEQRRRYLQWGAVAATGLLFVLTGAGLFASYARNQAYVADMAARTRQLGQQIAALPAQGTAAQLLPVLDALRTLPTGYAERDQRAPWLMRLGLYQGDKLGEGARIAYRKLLHDALLPRIQQRMEDQLRRGGSDDLDTQYETLRAYLMLGDASRFDPASVAAWAAWDDERSLREPGDDTRRAALAVHEVALTETLREGQGMPTLDAQLVGDTRLALARMPLPQRVYNQLKRQLTQAGLPEFSAAAAGGRDAATVLVRRSGEPITRGVNGMFSVAGYARFLELSQAAVSDVDKERWILAQQEASSLAGDPEQVRRAVLQLYYDDYIAQWDALLADVTVAPFSTLEQGARVANLLGGADSPLRKFLLAASKETTLGAAKAAPAAAAGSAVMGKLDAYKKRLASALGSGTAAGGAPVATVNPVDAHFDDLHKLAAGTPPPLDQTLAMLKDVAVYLDAAAGAKRTGAPPPSAEPLARLKLEGDAQPAPLNAVLKGIGSGSAGLTSGSERERLNALWTAGPAQFCRQAAQGRYPITRGATPDIPAEDFGRLFAPGGLIDDFFQKNLLQYVDMSGARWSWRSTAANASLGIPQSTLDEFQRAARIRDAWFGNGGRLASLRFELKPVALDPGISKLVLDIDGQQLTVTPGSVAGATFQLPSGKGSGHVQLDASPASGRGSLRADGPWAWLRMLDKGTVEPTPQAERYKLTFDLDGRKAVFDMTATSVVNPFRRAVLEQFRCMDKL
jgi:type VI secretion system protein ImpL